MESHSSSLSYVVEDPKVQPAPHQGEPPMMVEKACPATSQNNSFGTWIHILWAWVIHCLLTLGIAGFIIFYVRNRFFNLSERSPSVKVVGGFLPAPFSPLQSDIVTFLSSSIVILRCVLVAWTGPLSWRVSIFLMERQGIPRRDLKALLMFSVLSPKVYIRDFSTFIMGTLLAASLAANISSPILTGSISWVPMNRLVYNLPVSPVRFIDSSLSDLPGLYLDNESERSGAVANSAGLVGIAWGRELDRGDLKRASPSLDDLSINSTVENITLPYFKVHTIDWIKNIDEIPTVKENGTNTILRRVIDSSPVPRDTIKGLGIGFSLLIPNTTTNWSSDPMDSTIIEDTRLLAVMYGFGNESITNSITPNMGTLSEGGFSYVFAWVKFSAGVGQCSNYQCRVSSPSTVQNNTPIALQPHPLTFQTLSMAPIISLYLIAQNSSLPSLWNDLDNYVEAVLVRSYSGAWGALNDKFSKAVAVATLTSSNYIPSLPALVAYVDNKRVFIWLAIHLLITFLSGIFVVIQSSQSKYPLTGDTTLTPFYLDTADVPREANASAFRGDGVLKVENRGDRLKVKVESRVLNC